MRRKPNGAWVGIKGPQYTRVNGAWIFENISPWRLKGCNNTLYLNPFSETEITSEILDFPHAKVSGNEMEWCSGIDIFELLTTEALEATS
ncbi:hypothetical protein HR060_03965 [Catenovulum sp. SM1970]|uniref:hypothetical protein n=1 Tax=Marinifaba aquimaris TaxID=2741323 RepID=UPI00157164D2|nr:hypothetical protein [Marinifaba aquimaris]NTS76015.1 hypothetical protein [Marinifaba aquimaris]